MGWIRCVGIASRYPTMAHFTKVMGGGGDRKGRVQFGQVYGRADRTERNLKDGIVIS